MVQLFYFTGGGKAHNHYVDTILGSVNPASFLDLLPSEQRNSIKTIYSNQPIKVWGAISGENNTRNFENMNVGDAILVYKDKYFTHAGYISYKLISPKVAYKFWGKDDEGKTWELIYFLKYISKVNIPIEIFNKNVDYANTWKPQGFGRLSDDRLNRIIDVYGSVGMFINSLSGKEFSLES